MSAGALSDAVVRVVVVEDHPVMREATVRFLESVDDLAVVDAVESIEALVASAGTTEGAVDVVVLDLNLPGISGIEGLQLLTSKFPSLRALVLTMSDGADVRESARLAGASGFLTKGCAPTELVAAVRTVAGGGFVGLDAPTGRRPAADAPLDDTEVEVLRLLVAGRSVGDIATQLGVSFRQGALLISSIKQKTGRTSRSEWLQYAVDHDLL